MTRRGKIARLPKEIREQLNQQLDDGKQGKDLVSWLNSIPEVQSVIGRLFRGKAINKHNLSQWRKGGYREWQAKQEWLEVKKQLLNRQMSGV